MKGNQFNLKSILIFSLCMGFVLVAFSIPFSGAWFASSRMSGGSLSLSSFDVYLVSGSSSTAKITSDLTVQDGEIGDTANYFDSKLYVYNNGQVGAYVRIKLVGDNASDVGLIIDPGWIEGNDGYFYLSDDNDQRQALTPGQRIGLADSFLVTTATSNEISFAIKVEAIQSTNDSDSTKFTSSGWTNLPTGW